MQPLKSVAVAVKLKEPPAVAVPDRTPSGLRVTPPGSAPDVTAKEKGALPPVAVSVVFSGVPSGTSASDAGSTVIGEHAVSK